MTDERVTKNRWHDTPVCPVKQRDLEIQFQVLDHLGCSRLRDAKMSRRILDAALLADSHQQAKLAQFQSCQRSFQYPAVTRDHD